MSAIVPAPDCTGLSAAIAGLDNAGDRLTIRWADGHESVFHAIWLRDNGRGPMFRHPDNDQRLFDITDLPEQVSISAADLDPSGFLKIEFAPEGLLSRFEPAWLRAHCYQRRTGAVRRLWGNELQASLPRFAYADVTENQSARLAWLAAVRDYGVALLAGVPRKSGMVMRVAELFGYVRETNYGRYFEVRSVPSPINLAYTGLGLAVHTDNPYRDPVPGLQLLHCLENAAEGGESVVVDGFRAAALLRRDAPNAFALLTRYAVPFRFCSKGVDLQARAPLIELDDHGEVTAVRYNNRSIAPFDLPAEIMADFYGAYRRFAELLQDPALEVTFKLAPGELFIVDNRRVLHGRKAFAATGKRHLQGCYADRDGLESTLRNLEQENIHESY